MTKMASWHYAFLFPGSGQQLLPSNGISDLNRFGLEFDATIRLLVQIDEQGHMLDVGDVVGLTPPITDDLARRLENGSQFSVQCRNGALFISCTFATQTSNPFISLGWSRRLFGVLERSTQLAYWEMIRDFAKKISAAYVVIVDDACDNFEDRFVDVSGIRVLDTGVTHSYGHGIHAVWVDESLSARPPDGVSLDGSVDVGRGFRKYVVSGSL